MRFAEAAMRLITVASISFPVKVLTTCTFELIGRLGWAMVNPSACISWVTLPFWLKPLTWAIAGAANKKPANSANKTRFILFTSE
jgi:hypothetical protein